MKKALFVLLLTTAAAHAQSADWIAERARLWDQVEAACGKGAQPVDGLRPNDDLKAALRACQERNKVAKAAARPPGTIRLGDTPEYVLKQWGAPKRKDRMVSQYGITEWWYYSGSTVRFHDGTVEVVHTH